MLPMMMFYSYISSLSNFFIDVYMIECSHSFIAVVNWSSVWSLSRTNLNFEYQVSGQS